MRPLSGRLIDSKLVRGISEWSRNRKLQVLANHLPDKQIVRLLDVGTGGEGATARNVVFTGLPGFVQVTACGIDEFGYFGSLVKVYPHISFVRGNALNLPFADGAFDIAHSNAVIEHVIGVGARTTMVAEMMRVSSLVFITTPNKHFPIEVHSRLPIVHWLPKRIHNRILRALGIEWLARGTYFDPLSVAELRDVFPTNARVKIVHPDPFRMTLIAIADSSEPD